MISKDDNIKKFNILSAFHKSKYERDPFESSIVLMSKIIVTVFLFSFMFLSCAKVLGSLNEITADIEKNNINQ